MEAPRVLSRSTEIRLVTLCCFRAGWEHARVGVLETYGARAHFAGHMAAMYFTDRVRMIKIQLYNPLLPELATTTSNYPSSSDGVTELRMQSSMDARETRLPCPSRAIHRPHIRAGG